MTAPGFIPPTPVGPPKVAKRSFADILQEGRAFSGGLDQEASFAQSLKPNSVLMKYTPKKERGLGGLFWESAISASGLDITGGPNEMFGGTPSREVERFRSEHPIGGLVSVLAGVAPFFIIPQTAVYRGLAAGIPGFTKAISAAGALEKSGALFRAGAVREATIFAPLELGRIAGSTLNPEEGSVGRATKHAASELAFLGAFGGGLNFVGGRLKNFKSSRLKAQFGEEGARELRVAKHIGPQFNRTASDQTKWSYLRDRQKDFKRSEIADDVDILISGYAERIKTGPAPKNPGKDTTRYVAFMGSKNRTRRIESLYEAGKEGAKGAKGIVAKVFKLNGKGETDGYSTQQAVDQAFKGFLSLARGVRLGKDWESMTQFPRQLVPTTKESRARLMEILDQDFTKVGENQWLAREHSEGLTVVVKRLPEEGGHFVQKAANKLDPSSGRFYILKTNRPSRWLRDASAIHDTNAQVFTKNLYKWGRSARVADKDIPTLVAMERDAHFYDANQSALHTGKTRFSDNPNTSAEIGFLRQEVNRYTPERFRDFTNQTFDVIGEFANSLRLVGAPARLQGGKNPRLNNLILQAKKAFDEATQRANRIILGDVDPKFLTGKTPPLRALLKTAINPTVLRRTGGTEKLIRSRLANDKALSDFNRIWEEGMTIDAAKALNLHPSALKLQSELEALDVVLSREISQQAKALGLEEAFVPLAGHLRISRTWKGAWRAPIKDAETGEILGYGSGFTRGQAAEDANAVSRHINKQDGAKTLAIYGDKKGVGGADLSIKDDVLTAGSKEIEGNLLKAKGFDASVGLPTDISSHQADIFGFATNIRLGNPMVDRILTTRSKLLRSTPVTHKERVRRGGFLGAIGTSGRRFSVDDIITTHSAGIIETQRYLTREAFAAGPPKEQLAKLVMENSADAVTFNRVFNSYNGVSGPFAKTIERGIDAALGDVFGPGMASKMVRGANQAMFTLTLGAGDLGFAALNMITPIQTAWPEVSYLLSAPAEAIQKYYSSALIKLPSGGMRTVRFMDTWKFAKLAAGKVWRPDASDKAAMQWAFEHGAVGRDFVETVQGPMRSITEGTGGMWDTLGRMSEFPVVFSEEASRTYSFMLGRQVGKDFFRMSEEESLIFAQQFVNNTMFGYAAGDRPRMLTGALGAGWGLFKNWTTNYTGNLARYTGEASRKNFGPLAWSFATTGAVGGLAAVPAAGMADGMSRLLADKPLSDLIYDWVGNDPGDHTKPWMADMMMHGFFSNLGFTLRARAGVPTSHLATDLSMFTNISILERATSGLEALGSAVEESFDLRNPVNDPKFRREMLRAFAPRTLQRAMTTFGDQGVTSLRTGNSLLPALNLYEGALRSVGMTPVRVANAFEVHQNKIYDAEEKRAAIQKLGRRWADAEMNRDWEELARIYNDAAWGEGVPIDSVQRSGEARLRNMTEPLTQRSFDDAQTQVRLRMRGIY